MKTEYIVRCTSCGKELDDTALPLECSCSVPALIRADYNKKKIEVGGDDLGLYKLGDWLPLRRILDGSAPPVAFRSEEKKEKGMG